MNWVGRGWVVGGPHTCRPRRGAGHICQHICSTPRLTQSSCTSQTPNNDCALILRKVEWIPATLFSKVSTFQIHFGVMPIFIYSNSASRGLNNFIFGKMPILYYTHSPPPTRAPIEGGWLKKHAIILNGHRLLNEFATSLFHCQGT